MIKVLVAGSREYNKYDIVKFKLDQIIRIDDIIPIAEVAIISGGARGTDKLGERYAKENGYHIIKVPALWDVHGKAAGPIRNKIMAELCDFAIIFWDGKSRRTKSMIDCLKKENKSDFTTIMRIDKFND